MQRYFPLLTSLAAAFWTVVALLHWPGSAWLALQGLGLWLVRWQPVRHWPVIALAAGQVLLMPFSLPGPAGVFGLFWLVPFTAILAEAYRREGAVESVVRVSTVGPLRSAFEGYRTQHGQPLNALADASPVLLVFLRHAGCTFCRQTLAALRRSLDALAERGVTPVLVHHGTEEGMARLLHRYGLTHLAVIHDPRRSLYRHFGLEAGSWWQLANPWVIWRSVVSVFWQRHGMRRPDGDPRQLGGAFTVAGRQIRTGFHQRQSSDQADFLHLSAS